MDNRIALLTTDLTDTVGWEESLKEQSSVNCDIIDISTYDWMEKCLAKPYDIYLLRAPGDTNLKKQMFDERVEILVNGIKKKIYPSLTEIKIYENKKYFSYWLKANKINCPETDVFYSKIDALAYMSKSSFPLVAKINIGASGKGVRVLMNSLEAKKYIQQAFSKGMRPYIGPNLRTTTIVKKISNALNKKGLLKQRIRSYRAAYNEPQKYILFQEYIPHEYEWRVVVIGNTYFAHKKVVSGTKASGSLLKGYDNPPIEMLDFVRELSLTHGISSSSIDLFETPNGYLVNEIQTFFGQSDAFQMKVDGVIGRYKFIDNKWVFEAGDWARNQCYNLRLEHALQMIGQPIL